MLCAGDLKVGMKFFQLGISLTFTGWTSPPVIRRRLASPEAETRSHWPPPPPPPPRISATISFGRARVLALDLAAGLLGSNFFANAGSE